MLDVLGAWLSALRLDPGYYSGVDWSDFGDAVGVAVLAGVSTMAGHFAILALNKIRGPRLFTSALLSIVSVSLLYLAQALVIWLLGTVVLQRRLPLLELFLVALLALAPLVFNFLTVFPYLGIGLGKLLQVWSYLVLWFGVGSTFNLKWEWALLLTFVGWLVMQGLARVLVRPVNWLWSRMWTLSTGKPAMMTSLDILSGLPFLPAPEDRRQPVAEL